MLWSTAFADFWTDRTCSFVSLSSCDELYLKSPQQYRDRCWKNTHLLVTALLQRLWYVYLRGDCWYITYLGILIDHNGCDVIKYYTVTIWFYLGQVLIYTMILRQSVYGTILYFVDFAGFYSSRRLNSFYKEFVNIHVTRAPHWQRQRANSMCYVQGLSRQPSLDCDERLTFSFRSRYFIRYGFESDREFTA